MNNSAESPRTFVVERVFPHPPEKLWRALTEGPLLAQWMMNNDFEPVVGRKFQFRAKPTPNWNGVVDCEVLIVDPFQRLSPPLPLLRASRLAPEFSRLSVEMQVRLSGNHSFASARTIMVSSKTGRHRNQQRKPF